MKTKFKPGKELRFLEKLSTGKTISRKQAQSWFKLGNASATVLRLNNKGITVTRAYSGKGKTRRVKYSIAQ